MVTEEAIGSAIATGATAVVGLGMAGAVIRAADRMHGGRRRRPIKMKRIKMRRIRLI